MGKKSEGTTNGAKMPDHPTTGDIWTWTCLCAETKLLVGFHVGGRTFTNAVRFCRDLAPRFSRTPQISSDGLKAYQLAVTYAFGADADYGMLIKSYAKRGGIDVCTGARKKRISGNPDMSKVCTSYIERHNLTLRMQNRRFGRRTNAHSKILTNHRHMLALGFMHYNYCRKHQTLKQTPAQAAGLTGDQWSLEDVVRLIEEREQRIQEAAFEAAFASSEWKGGQKAA